MEPRLYMYSTLWVVATAYEWTSITSPQLLMFFCAKLLFYCTQLRFAQLSNKVYDDDDVMNVLFSLTGSKEFVLLCKNYSVVHDSASWTISRLGVACMSFNQFLDWSFASFLANVNSRSLYAIARPSVVCRLSVVCNARAPYSGGSNYWLYFYGIRYPGHLLTSTDNFTEIVPGESIRRRS